MENCMEVLQNIEHRTTLWSRNSTPRYIPQRIDSKNSNRYLYAHVHGSIIYNSQKVKTTHVSIDRWMDKQNVVHPYNGILFSHKKERNSDTCYNMDVPWGHYTIRCKPVIKRQIQIHEVSRTVICIETKCRIVAARNCEEGGMGS